MRLLMILISSLLVMCIAAEGQKQNRNESPTETLNEKRILMPPRNIKIKLSAKTKPQPLISLYKSYVGKKSLMRKFVPVARITEPPIQVTRRPVMKQRQLVVGPVTVKPHKKEDIHITLRRRVNFRPSFVKDTNRQEIEAKSVKPGDKEEKHVAKAQANNHRDTIKPKEEKIDVDADSKEFIFLKPTDSAAKEDSEQNGN